MFWLVALSPVGRVSQAIAYAVSVSCSVAAISESKKQIWTEAKAKATQAMNEEIEKIAYELEAEAHINNLQSAYAPEVHQDLVESLNHLYLAAPADTSPDTSASPSPELKLAILALLKTGKSKTYIIENVLGMKGRKFEEGKQLLQQILGDAN